MKKDPVRERAIELAGGLAAWKKSPLQHHFDRVASAQLNTEQKMVGAGSDPHATNDIHKMRARKGWKRTQ